MTPQTPWITENNRLKQNLAGVAMVLVGAVLAVGFRHFEGPGLTNSLAGFLLGLLLLAVGTGSLITASRQVITVDPRRRHIHIRMQSRFSTSTQVIRFNDIAEVSVGELGDREGGSISYHVALRLKTGASVPLFYPFFDGQWDPAVAQARCERLQQYLQAPA